MSLVAAPYAWHGQVPRSLDELRDHFVGLAATTAVHQAELADAILHAPPCMDTAPMCRSLAALRELSRTLAERIALVDEVMREGRP